MSDWENPRWIPGQFTPAKMVYIPQSDPESQSIILASQMICTHCGMHMMTNRVDRWPDGFTAPFGYVAFLVEHPWLPESILDQDAEVWFCPNNAKRFFVSYPLTVLEIDHAGMVKQSIVPPMWKLFDKDRI